MCIYTIVVLLISVVMSILNPYWLIYTLKHGFGFFSDCGNRWNDLELPQLNMIMEVLRSTIYGKSIQAKTDVMATTRFHVPFPQQPCMAAADLQVGGGVLFYKKAKSRVL